MIIARSPLRVSIGGGGTDLPSYYRENDGFLISAAIDKYVYVSVLRPFKPGIYLKYSEIESARHEDEIRHPIIREAIKMMNLPERQIELTALADVPSGTGLGSSGSFTTALLRALHAYQRHHLNQSELAELACHVEIDRLKEPIGKQDQYIAAYGGITCFDFHKNDSVSASPLSINQDTLVDLEDNLLLFFTGFSRKAGTILADQNSRTRENDRDMLNNLEFVKKLGYHCKEYLEAGDVQAFGELLHEHWEHKKARSSGMSNEHINAWYDTALENGAIGGKVVGAGGGGFLMFYAYDRNKLRHAMKAIGLEEMRFNFDFEGTKLVLT